MEIKLVILFIIGVVVQTQALTTQAPQNCDIEDGPLFLSPYIASNNIEEARRKSRVSCLPGGDNVESYSGYLTVDTPSCGSNLFFWFFPAAENPQTAPVLMWLNGGPGRSSMYGAIFENGPLQLKDRTKLGTTILTERPTNWARTFSMLYVDNPVGTGFSVTTGNCYAQNSEDVSRNLYSFMVQFYQIFPEYASLEFYVGGQSYAGKYVPAFAYFIHHQNINEQQTVHIPLAGIYLGGGFCDPPSMLSALPDYLYSVGMYSKHSRDQHRQKIEEGLAKPNHNPFYPEDKDGYEYISYYFGYMHSKTGYASFDNILQDQVQLDEFSLPEFFNRTDVVRALHAQHNFSQNFLTVVLRFGNDFMKSTKMEMGFLMDHYKVLYYTGSLDVVANINMAEAFLLSTPWSGREAYGTMDRILWKYQKHLAGYVTKVNNFTRVIVRNAGHDVPHDQPEWTLAMMKNFISDISWSR